MKSHVLSFFMVALLGCGPNTAGVELTLHPAQPNCAEPPPGVLETAGHLDVAAGQPAYWTTITAQRRGGAAVVSVGQSPESTTRAGQLVVDAISLSFTATYQWGASAFPPYRLKPRKFTLFAPLRTETATLSLFANLLPEEVSQWLEGATEAGDLTLFVNIVLEGSVGHSGDRFETLPIKFPISVTNRRFRGQPIPCSGRWRRYPEGACLYGGQDPQAPIFCCYGAECDDP